MVQQALIMLTFYVGKEKLLNIFLCNYIFKTL